MRESEMYGSCDVMSQRGCDSQLNKIALGNVGIIARDVRPALDSFVDARFLCYDPSIFNLTGGVVVCIWGC